ncbi:MAG: hypothetical protein QXN15_05820 [Candidatus Jordarchaeales archaeon]
MKLKSRGAPTGIPTSQRRSHHDSRQPQIYAWKPETSNSLR